MTQLLDPSGPYACVWDEAIDGCDIPEPQPVINPHISEADKLCFVMGCDAPPRDLPAPAVVPLPAGGLLLASALTLALALKMARALIEFSLTRRFYSSLPTAGNSCRGLVPRRAFYSPILAGDREARAVECSPN